MSTHLRFDDEQYEPSDSEDDYTEKEKELLDKYRKRGRKYSDSEEEVLGVGGDDESDDDKSDLALSDVEGQDDDDLPNERAWGKDKRKYYSTDYVDADYGGYDAKDAHLAELEEEEAKNLQKQLAQQLDEDDFSLDIFTKKQVEDKKQIEEVIKTDISKLSKRQKLQILEKESPEFFGLIEDFEAKTKIAQEFLYPIIQKYRKGQIANSHAADFVLTMYELILNYSTNIYMYLVLKSSRVNIENHPIIKRLYQYRQLLSQLDKTFEEVVKPQIEIILQENIIENVAPKENKKKLNLLKKLTSDSVDKKKKVEDKQPAKKLKLGVTEPIEEVSEVDEDMDEENPEEVEEMADSEQQKRAITYQMEKNKGLTPHRKKEQRNPRVKHRMKYRKAAIRRKGAVREPRKELSRYGGEISGIKASVSKSIKIKT